VSGLRGSGSHDIAVQDVFVPGERAVAYGSGTRYQSGPLYTFPIFGLLAVSVASVATGMARGAIDTFIELAKTKHLTGSRRLINQRSVVQLQVAQAEALLRAGRAFMFETVQEVWDTVVAGEKTTQHDKALIRLSACHATTASAQAIDLMYQAAGTGAIWDSSPIQRHFRDVHMITQHAVVASPISEVAGKVLLGLKPEFPML
jgi:alkylation response protein AidB-like acyl-CoA dehydrogenase